MGELREGDLKTMADFVSLNNFRTRKSTAFYKEVLKSRSSYVYSFSLHKHSVSPV